MAMAAGKANKRALYIGGLDKQVTEQVLYSAFIPFGPIKSAQVPMDFKTRACHQVIAPRVWFAAWEFHAKRIR
jgi:RNA recognition motif-containing protein